MTSKKFLVTGATGSQGGGVVRALSARSERSNQPMTILALTRDVAGAASKALAALPSVQVVQGDLDDPEPLFQQYGPFDGVYSVQAYLVPNEEKQGKAVADLCVKYKVGHLVYSGADFAGVADTGMEHAENKRCIEAHIHHLAETAGLSYTVLRPTSFYDNLHWPLFRDLVLSVWNPDISMSLILGEDIGKIGAEVLGDPAQWDGRTLELAAEELKPGEIARVWEEVTGTELEKKDDLELPEAMASTFKFVGQHKYMADVDENRRLFPFLTPLKDWLQTTPYAKKG